MPAILKLEQRVLPRLPATNFMSPPASRLRDGMLRPRGSLAKLRGYTAPFFTVSSTSPGSSDVWGLAPVATTRSDSSGLMAASMRLILPPTPNATAATASSSHRTTGPVWRVALAESVATTLALAAWSGSSRVACTSKLFPARICRREPLMQASMMVPSVRIVACCSACSQPSESAVTSIFFFFLFFESTTELSLRPGVVLSPAGNATIIDITVALVPRSALSGTLRGVVVNTMLLAFTKCRGNSQNYKHIPKS
mmetsp:Transcript_13327/g.25451  ORF Transcript_13327/g.25451 Transcript_13327/m.25451 type:complete len:254 (-) Transcript_13327:268-1029(-)